MSRQDTLLTAPETQALLEAIADKACCGLFASYGITLDRKVLDPALVPVHLSGVVGFSGPGIRGTCILAASQDPIERSNPTEGGDRDWIAELANQLVGRIRNQLLTHGAEVYVSTPAVLRGEHLAPLRRSALPPLSFGTERGNVFVWIDFETQPGLVLGAPIEVVTEGEAVMF